MNPSDADCTASPEWQQTQLDRLLGFEMLRRMVRLDEERALSPGELAERIGTDKNYPARIILRLRNAYRR